MQMASSPSSTQAVGVRSSRAQVYGLFALAMVLTVVGTFTGLTVALPLITSGMFFVLLIAELVIILTSRWWIRSSPLNMILFATFPLLSGLTVVPFLASIVAGYVNGMSILLNALIATTLLSAGTAVFALTTNFRIGVAGGFLFNALLGLIVFGILQLFFPALRGQPFELLVSGVGIVVFAGFLAYDIQRVEARARAGESAFILALSLYLDVFNLFLYVVRFMSAFGGGRRQW